MSFGSLNINGGASQLRKLQVVNLALQKTLDVVFLQETHTTPASHAEWNRMMKTTNFYSDSNSRTAGVAFLLNPHFHPSKLSFKNIIPGHLASLEFVINNINFTLLNVYAPSNSTERQRFYARLGPYMRQMDLHRCIIMAGDFNCTLQPNLDRNGAEPHPGPAKLLAEIIRDFKLQDLWRQQNPTTHQFTWSKITNNQVSLARLDRIYINSSFFNLSPTTGILPSGFSDHHLITVNYHSHLSLNRHSFWKLNVTILENPSFRAAFEDVWSVLLNQKHQFTDQRLWWDNIKAQCRGFCQQFCFLRTQEERRIKASVEKEILQIQTNLKTRSSPQQELRLKDKKAFLNTIIENQTQGALKRLRFQQLNLLDTPTRYFFDFESQVPRPQITALKCPDNSVITHPEGIKREARLFFSNLYKTKEVDLNGVSHLFDGVSTLTPEQRQSLEKPLTLEELSIALKSLGKGKSPGIDGLPSEFFESFWDLIGPELLSVFQESLEKNELPLSCRRAVLTLLPKKGDPLLISQWRPISLLCTDYKIFSKAIALRFSPFLKNIVDMDQTYCVPGRNIHDSISVIRDLIDVCDIYHESVGLVLLDQEKAFDYVSHEYLSEVLNQFGFGPFYFIMYTYVLLELICPAKHK